MSSCERPINTRLAYTSFNPLELSHPDLSLMTSLSYQPNPLSDQASYEEVFIGTTSSQILLSRAIADPISTVTFPELTASVPITSIFESNSQHIMTLGEVADVGGSNQLDDHGTHFVPEPASGHTNQLPGTGRTTGRESFSSALSTQPNALLSEPAFDLAQRIDALLEDERGRTMDRGLRYTNPLARAESRAGRAEAVIELNPTPIYKRISRSSTFFEDPTHPSAILDDDLLEPCPHLSQCANVSEVLGDSLEVSNDIQSMDSDDIISSVELSHAVPAASVETSSPPTLPSDPAGQLASQLPTEILQQIYYNLVPADFNSARHTCRTWFINSLEHSLLTEMHQRGGFASSIHHDLTANQGSSSSRILVNDGWMMSKRLSRECALGPDWRGHGLTELEDNPCAFFKTAIVDFTEVSVQNNSTKSSGTIFTVSSCGTFLMAANGCLVYVYELNKTICNTYEPGSLRPITSIICPARVLACSMDTSSRRYAIAILLDGRMGMVCDVSPLKMKSKHRNVVLTEPMGSPSISSQDSVHLKGASFLDRVTLTNSAQSLYQPFIFAGIASSQDVVSGDMTHSATTSGPSSRAGSISRLDILKKSRMDKLPAASLDNVNSRLRCFMPVENGPRSFYRNICSEDDPPRSVAICPQRRCVAFGCSSGIELHWVDALTGQDLNRWFPLTSPSDFLFFLPPRKSVDSAKKLRLISSAAKPGERPAIATRAFGGRSRSSPFWQRLGWGQNGGDADEPATYIDRSSRTIALASGINNGRAQRRPDFSDHYRAVPLSDGYHILFTDPASGSLCVGSDAPIGGPTKLLRKIWFEGPSEEGSPTIYAGGSDLSWGVRVVAAFGKGTEQSIWLFSVPLDIFAAGQSGASLLSGSMTTKPGSSHENNMGWSSWWPQNGAQEWLSRTGNHVPGLSQQSLWPLKIRGQEIGRCSEVVDLSIDAGPSLTVWAFGKDGISTVWKLDDGRSRAVKERLVMRDGTVREKDGEGDIEMVDADIDFLDSDAAMSGRVESFDGTSSFESSASSPTRKRKRQCRSSRNQSGDEMMDHSQTSGDEEDSDEEGPAGPAWTYLEAQRMLRRGYKRLETDFMTRVNIQIQ